MIFEVIYISVDYRFNVIMVMFIVYIKFKIKFINKVRG